MSDRSNCTGEAQACTACTQSRTHIHAQAHTNVTHKKNVTEIENRQNAPIRKSAVRHTNEGRLNDVISMLMRFFLLHEKGEVLIAGRVV